jgi:hypothetical protein
MSRLDDAVRSVPAEASTASDEAQEPTVDAAAATPEPTGNQGDGGQPSEGNERTPENVRGEVLRKMEKFADQMSERLAALEQENERLRSQYGVPAQAQPQTNNPPTLDDMSIQQLEAARANVPEENRAQFDAYLLDRKVQEKVRTELTAYQSQTERQQAETKFNEQAMNRWPQLRDRTSDLYARADQILATMPNADTNPRAVLDAANEAAIELGLSPSTGLQRTTVREPGRLVSGHNQRSGPGADPAVSTAEQKAIADKLRNAMPNGGFSEDQMKRIAESTQIYKDNINTLVKG